jgi:hypothetical protein
MLSTLTLPSTWITFFADFDYDIQFHSDFSLPPNSIPFPPLLYSTPPCSITDSKIQNPHANGHAASKEKYIKSAVSVTRNPSINCVEFAAVIVLFSCG